MNLKLPFDFERTATGLAKITVKGGLAGKICNVLIVFALAATAISWSVKLPLVALISLGFVFLLTFTMLWRLINLADKNPHSALMEGAEYLVHEQMMIGTKARPRITIRDSEAVQSAPVSLTPAEQASLARPEDDPSPGLPARREEP